MRITLLFLLLIISYQAVSQRQTTQNPTNNTSNKPPALQRPPGASVPGSPQNNAIQNTSASPKPVQRVRADGTPTPGSAPAYAAGIENGKLTPEKLWQLKRVSGEAVSGNGQYIYYGIGQALMKENKIERNLYRIALTGGEPQQLTKSEGSESNVQLTKDGKMLYTLKGQLWVSDADGNNARLIAKPEVTFDNIKLSPSGTKLMFTRDVKVRRNIPEIYPDLDKANAIITDDLMYRHWTDYEDADASHVFVADFNNYTLSNEKDIMRGEVYNVPQMPMGGAEDLVWGFDDSYVLYVCKKLTGKEYALSTNTDIYKYDLASGATTNLSEGMKGYDTKPMISADGKTIYWLSMARDGYEADKNDLVAYDIAAKTKTNLTKTFDMTVEDYMLSKDAKKIYYAAYKDGTEQIFVLDFSGAKNSQTFPAPRQITNGDFDIASMIGQTNDVLVVTRTDMNHAAEIYTVNLKTGVTTEVTHTNDEAYKTIGMCRVEKRWIKTSDNQKMLTWIIYPPDFDANKKYPALLYCQGGPQSALSQFYSFRWNFQLMASNGYIVIAPSRRGMPGFGVKWNEDISKDWGGQAIQDYLSATDSISKLPFVDRNRLGAVGASYGGYSVYMLAGVHENRFKTFIAHCGLFDIRSWYGTTEEMWFANWDVGGPYWEKPVPESYTKSNPVNFVAKWNKPIMIIHGEKDYRVPVNQGLEAYQAAQLKGLKSRLLLFPDEGHWVMQPQNGLLWQREFYKWLGETL